MFINRLLSVVLLTFIATGAALAQQNPFSAGQRQAPLAVESGKLLEIDGKPYLYGGENPGWHFDIGNLTLDVNKMLNGVGREHYPALLEPEFVNAGEASEWLSDDNRVIVVNIGGETKVYPIRLMIRHEVVNDVVGGVPVLPVYCTRAKIPAVFDRRVLGRTFTFGVSGYTYSDPEINNGLEVLILWDRDSESLWWPMMGSAVSGPMVGERIERIDIPQWQDMTWGEARAQFAEAVVLAPGQTLDPPESFPRLGENKIGRLKDGASGAQ